MPNTRVQENTKREIAIPFAIVIATAFAFAGLRFFSQTGVAPSYSYKIGTSSSKAEEMGN